jgi:hypothetical protein
LSLQLYSHNLQFFQLQKHKQKQSNSISIQTKSNMKLNLFFLSTAAMVNAASATCDIDLGDAANYAVLSKAISTVPQSVITGDIAVLEKSAKITGFSLITAGVTVDQPYPLSVQVTGDVKATDFPIGSDDVLTIAFVDMEIAYLAAAGCTTTKPLTTSNELADQTLTPGVYTFITPVLISSGELTFDGGADDVFVIQTTGHFKAAAGINVVLSGGAQAKNIFWQVAGAVTVGAGAHMEGIFLGASGVTFVTGASLNGRILDQTAVALQMATITQPSS